MTYFCRFAMGALGCQIVFAAALVPYPSGQTPVGVAGLEANRGQAKADVLFVARAGANVAVRAQSIEFSPYGVRQEFVGGHVGGVATFSGQLPGLVNSYAGADAQKWVTGIPRYAIARVAGVYDGVDAVYTVDASGQLALRMLLAAGVDPQVAGFEIKQAATATLTTAGDLLMRLGPNFRIDPALVYPAPKAAQAGVERTARYEVRSTMQWGVQVDGWDRTVPLEIEMKLGTAGLLSPAAAKRFAGADGSTYAVGTVGDAAGKDAPFPQNQWAGCGVSIGSPISCSDVAVYKFTGAGELSYVTYLSGRTSEVVAFARLAPDGSLIVAGATNSSDFPVSAGALQTAYAGPAATYTSSISTNPGGDFFAARLDAATGVLRAATYLGGPNADEIGEPDMGADGSLFFLHKWLDSPSAGMPTTRGALMSECTGNPCQNAYAAHVSANLDRLLYGTYLPGHSGATARLHTDGSVYFVGSAEAGFPVTPTAYQKAPAGGFDGFVARLDPTGSSLMFGTYYGTPKQETILRMAVAPDGSVWAHVSSFVDCCVNIEYSLVRIDAKGETVLVNKPYDVGDLATDSQGNLFATGFFPFQPSENAFLSNSCGAGSYVKLSPAGDLLFGTYLPYYVGYDFAGRGENGLPILASGDGLYQVSESVSAAVYTGCIVDGASFVNQDRLSPGAIVTLFGSEMGPREGVAFQLVDGKLPTSLSGTQVFVNGTAAPLLYVSHGQVNMVLPYDLAVSTRPEIQVVRGAAPGNVIKNSVVQRAGISIFKTGDPALLSAAALNEDGTVNTAANPAKKGSRVVLFGTGGGPTNPASVAGEVTPLELRPLAYGAIVSMYGVPDLPVEYAGGALGLIAGVMQLNVKLPETFPTVDRFPANVAVLNVVTPGLSYYPGSVTVYVK
ncbi:MAG: hypothetical protein ABI972_18025 [Acidobacteriota bacterium]